MELPWWAWALAALIVVGLLGVNRVDLNANVLAVLLVLECIAVVALRHRRVRPPRGGLAVAASWSPSSLFVPGVGVVFAFGVAAFIGFESGAIYSEEVRNPRVTVARATFVAVGFTGLFYAVSAWAMVVTVGAADLQKQTAENGPGVVFAGLAEHWGDGVATLANVLFLTSVFAALLSFHNGVARYLFALGRERVLPAALSRVSTRSGGPVAGSLAQSALALVSSRCSPCRGRPGAADVHLAVRHGGGRRRPADGGHVGRGGRLLPHPTGRRVGVAAGDRPHARHDRAGRARRAADRQLRRVARHRPGVAAALDPARPRAARRRCGRDLGGAAEVDAARRYAAIGTTGGTVDDDESVVLDLPGPKHELRR